MNLLIKFFFFLLVLLLLFVFFFECICYFFFCRLLFVCVLFCLYFTFKWLLKKTIICFGFLSELKFYGGQIVRFGLWLTTEKRNGWPKQVRMCERKTHGFFLSNNKILLNHFIVVVVTFMCMCMCIIIILVFFFLLYATVSVVGHKLIRIPHVCLTTSEPHKWTKHFID